MKLFKKIICVALIAAMLLSCSIAVFGTPPTDPGITPREIAHRELATVAAAEGMVLLENNGVLPIAKSGNIAIFGQCAKTTLKGGTASSGRVNNRTYNYRGYNFTNTTVFMAFDEAGYNITSSEAYYNSLSNTAFTDPLISEANAQPTEPTDTAIYVIGRLSNEGGDRQQNSGDGRYYLSNNEIANLNLLSATYENLIVVLNNCGMMDTTAILDMNKETPDSVDALFLMSQAGMEGGTALVQVLNGTVTPSGKLATSFASSYNYYPASATFGANDGNTAQENYYEGVYVGYRFFDSFYKSLNPEDPDSVVNYPFGYGMSYTDFDIKVDSVTADMNNVTVTATVMNTGQKYSGKEVVQVYFSAPQGNLGLDKPYQELAAFGKTDELGPGESQTLTISFKTTEMSSYNEDWAAYIMDRGSYYIRVGNSSRNTHVAAVLTLANNQITEQLYPELDDQSLGDDEWKSDPANYYTYEGEAEEIAAAPRIALSTIGFRYPNNSSPYEQNVIIGTDHPYYAIDKGLISSINAYVDPAQDNWEGTGGPYAPKTGERIVQITPAPAGSTLFDVYKGNVSLESFVASLSVTQMANIVEGLRNNPVPSTLVADGSAGFTTPLYESMGIPCVAMPDAPSGVRVNQTYSRNGVTYYQYATAWPTGTLLAQTYNSDLINEVGVAVGVELEEFGGTWWLAPGMNIHRDPLCGRNYEYYSEDPYVTGMAATSISLGVQSIPGIGVTLKHYFANNQEASRNSENNTISQRAMREIYLKGFEMAMKNVQPMAVMSCYNRNQGTYTAGDYDSLMDILRGEWGFRGLVMTDWGGVRAGIVNCMYAGNDLIMPGGAPNDVINAMLGTNATMRLGDLQRSVRNILTVMMDSLQFGELAELQGVDGIVIESYTEKYSDLLSAPYLTVGKGSVIERPAVGSVTLNVPALTSVKKGATLALSASVSPIGADASITWTSNNPSVATVDANGVVTGVKTGNAIITGTTVNGKVCKTTVTVK